MRNPTAFLPFALPFAALLCALPASAGEFSYSVEVDLVSQFVWRGVQLDDQESLQPSVTLGYAFSDSLSIDVNAWWNFALDDHGSDVHEDLLFEQDFTLSVSYSLTEHVGLQAGYIYWSNPRSDIAPGIDSYQTDELYLGAGYATDHFFVDATVYADIDAVEGYYVDVNGGVVFDLGGGFSLEPSAHFGLAFDEDPNPDDPAEAYWFIDDGLVDGSASLALSYELGEHMTLGASGHYSRRFDDYEELTGGDDHYTWAGISFAATF
ncbi:MAG: hypothetical protein GY856_48245 [bacterium]|nr:hypothetical protein [bacterium]